VSVGTDNDYGHPALTTLQLLRRAGMRVERTDLDGDVAVTVHDGGLQVRARGGR
jgi:competence protein ComEC